MKIRAILGFVTALIVLGCGGANTPYVPSGGNTGGGGVRTNSTICTGTSSTNGGASGASIRARLNTRKNARFAVIATLKAPMRMGEGGGCKAWELATTAVMARLRAWLAVA